MKHLSIGLALFLSVTSSEIMASDSLLWSSSLNKGNSFKNYSLINESDEGLTDKLTGLVGSRAGKEMLDATYLVTNRSGGMITAESTLKSPDLQGNKISTQFSSKNYSIKKSTILESYTNGQSRRNKLSVMSSKDGKGNEVRSLVESATAVTTQLLDNTAPLVDIVSVVYLMAGINDQSAKIIHNKPIYFYLNGTIRKATIQAAGNDNINWFGQTLNVKRFNMLRDSSNIGSLWVDTKTGDPVKIKVGGLLNFSVKPN